MLDYMRRQAQLVGCCVAIMVVWISFPTEVLAGPIALKGANHEDYRGTPRLEFPDAVASKAKSAEEYLKENSGRYRIPADLSNLELMSVRQSLVGTHTRYRQLLNGLPVENAEIIVSHRKSDGLIYQVFNNTYPVEKPVPVTKNILGRDAALQKAWDHLRVYGHLKHRPKADLIYMPFKNGFRLVYKTLLIVDGPFGYWEHKINALSGDVVSVRRHEISEKYRPYDVPDFSAYKGPTTSLQKELAALELVTKPVAKKVSTPRKSTVNGTALVFDPDPRTALANDALVDSSPASAFNAAYVTRTLRDITENTGVYYLEGPWVSITNMNSELPLTEVSTTTNGNWTAKRGDNAFNDVMCYFHIDQNQRYIQSLGYTGATGIQELSIHVDSDGLNGADNAWYVPDQNYIAFGHGDVDDDEDADVILHEYGHAVTFGIDPNWGGGDADAIGEGFGDYWGASYSWTCVNGSTYHPEWAVSWDGHSADSWAGRFLDMTDLTYDSNRTYGAHETINSIANYSDQLWGTPIYQAFRDLISLGRPRTEMDTIIIESFYGVSYGVTMRDMANATVNAAMALFPSGPHATKYFNRFTNQLILVASPLPTPTLIYPVGGETITVRTGTTVNVQWSRNGAPPYAATVIEYNTALDGLGTYFQDNVEGGINGWVASKTGGSSWSITPSSSHTPVRSWFAVNDAIGTSCDQFLRRSSIVVSNGYFLAFWHSYNLEAGYDGGVVEISTNGTTWIDIGADATQNGYNTRISSSDGSLIAGRRAFSSSSGGFIETRIPLTNYAGQTVSIRFRESDDATTAATGWWIDDIRIYIDSPWQQAAVTPTNTSSYGWVLPVGVDGTNCGVRVKQTTYGSNYSDSAWATSSGFIVSVDYWLGVNIDGQGTLSNGNAWYAKGSNVQVMLTPSPYVTFAYWAGDTNGCNISSNSITVLMDRARNITGMCTVERAAHNTPKWWLAGYGLTNFDIDELGDQDGDGLCSWQEYIAGMVPTNQESIFRFKSVGLAPSQGIVISWPSISNRFYDLSRTTNLLNSFTIIPGASNMPATPYVNCYTDTLQNSGLFFYRVNVRE